MNRDAALAPAPRGELIEHLPFTTDRGLGARARIGLIVLATDYTIEHEFRQVMALPGVSYYQSRIRNSPQITPATLTAMASSITECTDVILPGSRLDVVAFACTSASMVLGESRVFDLIHAARPDAKATTPITAAFAAFDAFGAKRIGVLTPYRADVNDVVRGYIETKGYVVPVFGSFNEENDGIVASIDAASLKRGIDSIMQRQAVDMVFVSCTSVRLAEAAAGLEREVGVPVTSSNHALAWHCQRLAGIADKQPHWGRLYER
jgi:maleate isomerase